jgi:hypothetical protein
MFHHRGKENTEAYTNPFSGKLVLVLNSQREPS